MRRFLIGCLVVFILLVVKTHPVFGLTCGAKCGPANPEGDTNCSACCVGKGSNCSAFCNSGAGGSNTCAWSQFNACTKWCAPGPCDVNGWQGQFCCDGVKLHENDYQITACGSNGGGGYSPAMNCGNLRVSGSPNTVRVNSSNDYTFTKDQFYTLTADYLGTYVGDGGQYAIMVGQIGNACVDSTYSYQQVHFSKGENTKNVSFSRQFADIGTFTFYCKVNVPKSGSCSSGCVNLPGGDPKRCGMGGTPPDQEWPNSSITIHVVEPPPSCSFSSGPTSVVQNASAQYCITATNAPNGAEIWKSPTGNQDWGTSPIRAKSVPGCGTTSFATPGTYYVVCNAYGSNDNPKCTGNPWWSLPSSWIDCGPPATLTVVVHPPPTASCTVSPNPVPYGGNPGITLSSTNASYCEVLYGTMLNGFTNVGSGYFTTGTYPMGVQTTPGNYLGRVECYNSDWVASATSYCNYTVNPAPSVAAWFQVKDGDVTTNGNLKSTIPLLNYFELPGLGGFPGIPSYNGSATFILGGVSVKPPAGWLVNSAYTSTKEYKSDYFLNAIPSGVTPTSISFSINQSTFNGAAATGYNWYEYDPSLPSNGNQPLSINGSINFGSKKVIIIVKGADVNLNGNITLTKGSGFFLLVAGDKTPSQSKGNIIIDPTNVAGGGAPNLVGIYVSDGEFRTGTKGANDSQLWVRGSVIAYGGVKLQRKGDTANPTAPAELFEFAPDQELLFPRSFSRFPSVWREVAP